MDNYRMSDSAPLFALIIMGAVLAFGSGILGGFFWLLVF